jgi:hypothetical protein
MRVSSVCSGVPHSARLPMNFGTESPDFDVPITGGTGDFANVRGVAHVHLTENGETDTLELLPKFDCRPRRVGVPPPAPASCLRGGDGSVKCYAEMTLPFRSTDLLGRSKECLGMLAEESPMAVTSQQALRRKA